MNAVGKGDWVQCVDDSPCFDGEEYPRPHIRKDGCYCVERAFLLDTPWGMSEVFYLMGLEAPDPDGDRAAFSVYRFKPLGGNAPAALKRLIPISVGAGYEDALI